MIGAFACDLCGERQRMQFGAVSASVILLSLLGSVWEAQWTQNRKLVGTKRLAGLGTPFGRSCVHVVQRCVRFRSPGSQHKLCFLAESISVDSR